MTRSPIIADLHMHTLHSHGQHSPEEMVAAAVSRGLSIIGFSEHSPRPEGYAYPIDYQTKLREHFPLYVQQVGNLAREAKQREITILLGLEVDYIPGQEAYAATLCKAYAFDYIIGGLHFSKTWGFDYSPDEWSVKDEARRFAFYSLYYRDLAAMCQTGLFDIAAHPDLIKIFTIDSFNEWIKTRQALSLIKNALISMKENGVIMEVSSAGLRKPCQEVYPGPRIMQEAAKLDLPICFASDAHCVNTPAYAFEQLASYAHSFGYTRSFIVERGEARQIPFSTAPRS